jgi:hypothetical protein
MSVMYRPILIVNFPKAVMSRYFSASEFSDFMALYKLIYIYIRSCLLNVSFFLFSTFSVHLSFRIKSYSPHSYIQFSVGFIFISVNE